MIRLGVVVEGPTEEEFVKKLLAVHLAEFDIETTATIVGEARSRERRGGNVTVDALAKGIGRLMYNKDAVTTLVDFYGFRDRPSSDIESLELEISSHAAELARATTWREDRMFAYVQRHEFEGLLFSHVESFAILPGLADSALQELEFVRKSFATPEDINDSRETAPSKRLMKTVNGYSKREHGWLVAESIGLETIRAHCPRFGSWLTRLEQLGRAG